MESKEVSRSKGKTKRLVLGIERSKSVSRSLQNSPRFTATEHRVLFNPSRVTYRRTALQSPNFRLTVS